MGRHRRGDRDTPVYDSLQGKSLEELALLPQSVRDALQVELEQWEAQTPAWRGLSAPPEAHSLVLPAYLGVTEPAPRTGGTPRSEGCTDEHHRAWRAKQLTMRFLQWFTENEESPHHLGTRPRLRATTLSDHLSGKAVMQDDVARDWIKACGGLQLRNNPDPRLYYWRNRVYQWPEVPMTVAGQQANFAYPGLLAFYALAAMRYHTDMPCYCRVLSCSSNIRRLQRTGEPEFQEVILGRASCTGHGQVDMLYGFHPEYQRLISLSVLLDSIKDDPGEAVRNYIRWDIGPRGA